MKWRWTKELNEKKKQKQSTVKHKLKQSGRIIRWKSTWNSHFHVVNCILWTNETIKNWIANCRFLFSSFPPVKSMRTFLLSECARSQLHHRTTQVEMCFVVVGRRQRRRWRWNWLNKKKAKKEQISSSTEVSLNARVLILYSPIFFFVVLFAVFSCILHEN